jgi:HD-like signal output (HDOD) protein/ActR/RegA family two-component response regulator
MKKILIANSDIEESQKLIEIIGQNFDVFTISRPEELPRDLQGYNLALVDFNISESYGMNILTDILNQSYIPILILAPPDNPKYAAEAIKLGAFNYIIKTDQYFGIVEILVQDTIRKFEQRSEMIQTIIELKRQVNELEQQIASGTKTCNISNKTKEEPTNVIEKAAVAPKSRKMAFNDVVRRLKRGEINLPTPPKMQIQFDEMVRNQKGIHEIANLLKQDVSISSQLISISNSVYFQGMVENITVEQAITRLGLITARKYVVIICNRSLYVTQKKKNMEWMERLWKHSLCSGLAAQFVCEMTHQKQSEELFSMGLFHDIGKLILLQIMAELDVDIVDDITDEDERTELFSMISCNHGAFGAMLLKRWGFSKLYQQIAMNHDNPENADPISRELLIVNFANIVSKSMGYCLQETLTDEEKIEPALSTNLLKIDAPTIATIKAKIQEHMNSLQQVF